MISDLRTATEKQLHQLVKEVLDHFERNKVKRLDFRTVMGHIRDADRLLENKRLGCPSGKHLNDCLCDHGIEETTKNYKIRLKKRAD